MTSAARSGDRPLPRVGAAAWVGIPRKSIRVSRSVGFTLADGHYVLAVARPIAGWVLPALLILGFVIGANTIGYDRSWSDSLALMVLVALLGFLSTGLAAWLLAGFVVGDFVFGQSQQFSEVLYWQEPWFIVGERVSLLIGYGALSILGLVLPRLCRALLVDIPRTIQLPSQAAFALVASLNVFLVWPAVRLWSEAAAVAIRPLFTWSYAWQDDPSFEPLQDDYSVIIAAAVLATLARVLLLWLVERSDGPRSTLWQTQRALAEGPAPAPIADRVPQLIRVLMAAGAATLLAAGMFESVGVAAMSFALFAVTGASRTDWLPMDGWRRLMARFPILLRLLVVMLIADTLRRGLVDEYDDSFAPLAILVAVSVLGMSLLVPGPPADPPDGNGPPAKPPAGPRGAAGPGRAGNGATPKDRTHPGRLSYALGLALLISLGGWAKPAVAGDCSALSDCFGTAGSFLFATWGLVLVIGVSFILNSLPGVSTAVGVVEMVTGKDLITGEDLSPWERALGVLPFLRGLRQVSRLGKITRIADRGEDAADAADAVLDARKNIDRAADVGSASDNLGDIGRKFDKALPSRPMKGDPVDVVTGQVVLEETDLVLPGVLDLVVSRTYLSSYRWGLAFGDCWGSSLDVRCQVDRDTITVFDEDGSVIRMRRPPGPQVSTSYDRGRRWVAWTASAGADAKQPTVLTILDTETWQRREFARPRAATDPWRVNAIIDRFGSRVDYVRDRQDRTVELRHSGGYRVAIAWESNRVSRLDVMTGDSESLTVRRFAYDRAGRLSSVMNGSGLETSFEYTSGGLLKGWKDRNGTTYQYRYDQQDRCVETIGTDGIMSGSFAFDERGRTTTHTDSNGASTAFEYNEAGLVTAVVDALGGRRETQWDQHHQLTQVTEPDGATYRFDYDEFGNQVRAVDPVGRTTTTTFTADRQIASITLADGATTSYQYQGQALIAVTDPLGATTRFQRARSGAVTQVTDPAEVTQHFEVDRAGLTIAAADASGARTRIDRDLRGRPIRIHDPVGGTVVQEWSVDSQPTKVTHQDGSEEQWTWDGEGNLRSHVDQRGLTTRFTSTAFDQPATVERPDGTRLEGRYDGERRLVGISDNSGSTWSLRYDPAGNLTHQEDLNGRTLTFEHDPAGRLVRKTNASGQVQQFTYNAAGDLEARNDDGVVTRYRYDKIGRLVGSSSPGVDHSITRDGTGRIVAESWNDHGVEYTYDLAGRTTSRRTTASAITGYDYDDLGRLARLTADGDHIDFEYDAAGREISRTFSNTLRLRQQWTSTHMLSEQALEIAAPTPRELGRRDWDYYPAGELRSATSTHEAPRHYHLDAVGRVHAITREPTSPDPVTESTLEESYRYSPIGSITHFHSRAHDNTAAATPGDHLLPPTGDREAPRQSHTFRGTRPPVHLRLGRSRHVTSHHVPVRWTTHMALRMGRGRQARICHHSRG